MQIERSQSIGHPSQTTARATCPIQFRLDQVSSVTLLPDRGPIDKGRRQAARPSTEVCYARTRTRGKILHDLMFGFSSSTTWSTYQSRGCSSPPTMSCCDQRRSPPRPTFPPQTRSMRPALVLGASERQTSTRAWQGRMLRTLRWSESASNLERNHPKIPAQRYLNQLPLVFCSQRFAMDVMISVMKQEQEKEKGVDHADAPAVTTYSS